MQYKLIPYLMYKNDEITVIELIKHLKRRKEINEVQTDTLAEY